MNIKNLYSKLWIIMDCGAILFHSTTKENLSKIMKEGIKPGAGNGWCNLAQKAGMIRITEDMKKECSENIFLSGSLDSLEKFDLKEMGIDTILITCIDQNKLFIDNKSFKEWDQERAKRYLNRSPKLSELTEIRVKQRIPPKNIIGCLEIKKYSEEQPNLGRYKLCGRSIDVKKYIR